MRVGHLGAHLRCILGIKKPAYKLVFYCATDDV